MEKGSDSSGENRNIKEDLFRNNLFGINIEYTSPHTPQQNGIVEKGFDIMYDKVRCMMNHANLPHHLKISLWSECCQTVTYLSNITVASREEKSVMNFSMVTSHEHLSLENLEKLQSSNITPCNSKVR